MSIFFLQNNIHFALEILGAEVFLAIAWLAFDAYLIRRDFLTISRGIGFVLLAVSLITHSSDLSSEIWIYAGNIFYILGLIFILWNLILEKPSARPEFKAILILPGVATVSFYYESAITVGLALIAYFSYRQYRTEFKNAIRPLGMGFTLLALSSFLSIFNHADSFGALWIAVHFFELCGFFTLGWWVWSYLQLRIREELLLIFISFALMISVIISFTFSNILVGDIEADSRASLSTNVRVLDFSIIRLKEEALAKVRLIAARQDIKSALEKNDFENLDRVLRKILVDEKLGFLTLVDKDGMVILRAHSLSKKGDDLSSELAVKYALNVKIPFVNIESSPAEGFSISASSPLETAAGTKTNLIGAIVAGFQLDGAFADDIKKITGLDIAIYDHDIRVSTTLLNSDLRTRSIGIHETNKEVLKKVLGAGEGVTLSTSILSRPFLASYLPLKNADMDIVGMIAAERPQQDILETAQAINRSTLLIVMAIMLLLIIPIYIITKRLSEEI